jgi:hypothetical protein
MTEGHVRRIRADAALRVALAVVFALVASAALADQFLPTSDGWKTYINDRFGMSFDFPADVFAPQPPPENGDGRAFRSESATLQIVAFHNIDDQTPGALKRELLGGDGYEDVTYSPTGQTWFVLSGFRGDRIFYEKYLFSGGVVSVFGIEFPEDEKPYYAPIIERIEDSFDAGHSD